MNYCSINYTQVFFKYVFNGTILHSPLKEWKLPDLEQIQEVNKIIATLILSVLLPDIFFLFFIEQ